VRNPTYLDLEYPASFISESTLFKECKSGQFEWNDEEIAAIRLVLKRLTAIRILNSNDAEDLVQDTLLTMLTKPPAALLEKGPLAWSLGILRKKVGNYYRKVQRYAPLNEKDSQNPEWMHAASPERRVFQKELQSIVDEVLSELPPFQRQAWELIMEGLNAREIMDELNSVRYQNVINRLYRGRKKLATALAKCGYGPDAAGGMRRMRRSHGKRSVQGVKTGLSA
jgi:RNA polymerase sigma factor (sigma-70 family)